MVKPPLIGEADGGASNEYQPSQVKPPSISQGRIVWSSACRPRLQRAWFQEKQSCMSPTAQIAEVASKQTAAVPSKASATRPRGLFAWGGACQPASQRAPGKRERM